MLKVWGSGLIAAGVVLFAGAAFAQDSCNTDFNGDGVTDVADTKIFQAALGTQEGDSDFLAQADLDGDGTVSTADYALMLACN